MRSFWRGLVAPFRGAHFIARRGLWGYLAAPVVVNLAVVAGALTAAANLVRRRAGGDLFEGSPVLSWIAVALLAALVGVLLFIIVQPVVSAPFVDKLTERAERLVRGHAPDVALTTAVGQALVHGLAKLALFAFAALVAVVLGALTGVGAALGIALGALFLAYDGFDYPLARRGAGFKSKWSYLAVHPAQTLGYCVGASVFYLVPLGLLVAPSCAAVGATLAYLDSATDSGTGSPVGEDARSTSSSAGAP